MAEKDASASSPVGNIDNSLDSNRPLPPVDIPQRWARCGMRFALLISYYLFLFTAPSAKLSISTIADAGDGATYYSALRQ